MKFEQFLKGLYILEESFQDRGFKISDKKESLLIWYEIFKDDSESVFMLSVKRFLATSKFAPTIAALRECIQEITNPTASLTVDDSWGEVTNAIRHFGWPDPKGALATMSPITQKIVRAMDYLQLCRSETPMADRAHFIKMFEQYKQRERSEYLLPDALKKESLRLQEGAIKLLADKMQMP